MNWAASYLVKSAIDTGIPESVRRNAQAGQQAFSQRAGAVPRAAPAAMPMRQRMGRMLSRAGAGLGRMHPALKILLGLGGAGLAGYGVSRAFGGGGGSAAAAPASGGTTTAGNQTAKETTGWGARQ